MNFILIAISQYSCKNKFFRNLNSALIREFDIKKSKSLEKASWLAACLIALEDLKSARLFLESFSFDIRDDSRSYARGHQLDALGMLAFICLKESDDSGFKNSMNVIVNDNCNTENLLEIQAKAKDELSYSLEEREGLNSIISKLTQSEIAMGYCSNVLIFSGYYALLVFNEDHDTALAGSVLNFLEEELGFLKDLLVEG